jgi:predicted nucleic acid-binding protein
MIIVSDTSPVSNLILIGRLDILQRLFSEVVVPPAVDEEIRALERLGKDIREYQTAKWITVLTPFDFQKVNGLRAKLDEGEAQAIALALEINCDLLLMDERIGTRIAREEGLQTVGLIGVLIKAKQQQIVSDVRPILAELKDNAGFWLGRDLENKILEELGEVQDI